MCIGLCGAAVIDKIPDLPSSAISQLKSHHTSDTDFERGGDPTRVIPRSIGAIDIREKITTDIESSYSCFGGTPNTTEYQTCQYRRVCFYNDKFHFVVRDRPTSPVRFDVRLVGAGTHKILRSREFERLHVAATSAAAEWAPEIVTVDELVAAVGDIVPWMPNPHLLYISYNSLNIGHFLGDELFPAYAALAAFDAITADIQLLRMNALLTWSCDHLIFHNRGAFSTACKSSTMYDKVGLITDLPVKTVSQLQSPVCFDRLVAGTSGDHCRDTTVHGADPGDEPCLRNSYETLWGFRCHILRRLGIPLAPQNISRPKVIIWNRRNKRVIPNIDDIIGRIRSEFHDYIEVETYEDWSHIHIRDQLLSVSRAAVYISAAGGGSFVGMFLPRGATKIQINFRGHLDWHVFINMAYIQTTHIPIPSRTKNVTRMSNSIIAAVRDALIRFRHHHLQH